ncbi:holo-ACP synthase [Burkholderiaceae bacterium DAT-1]|nr:holo-ACP synthase [Burkholderiaceae bacterium DAT-1]
MIFGIGTDLCDVERISGAYQKHGDRLLARLLSEIEISEFQHHHDPVRFLAKRWAAKEAFAKALGHGVRPPVTLNGITISHDEMGKPFIITNKLINEFILDRGINSIHLSLSDEANLVLAFVVIEANPIGII